ncbi:MAG TPA: hypothetical protein VJ201_07535 [Candidatus Babeliales bacterium]|nr:hypothetical protein [Candidatus Babeliales bacterium]
MNFWILVSILSVVALFSLALGFWNVWRKYYYIHIIPERTIKVCVHYPNNRIRYFWRLIPKIKRFNIQNKVYFFDDKFLKTTDLYAVEHKGKTVMEVEGRSYELDSSKFVKGRFDRYPEIHYFYDYPQPISFDFKSSKAKITSEELQIMQDNDLFHKLLSLSDQNKMLLFILVVCAVNVLLTLFVIAKMMEWIK